jgi:SseB protein N-terminal domain
MARSRLLVPIVAAVADAAAQHQDEAASGPAAREAAGPELATGASEKASEKASQMSIPTLIGHDGRPAVPAFTCLDSLRRWSQDARPVPAEAADVWAAAVADGCAVVVDVAGPVPLVIDGARLAALASGGPVPSLEQDPDVLAAARAAAAGLTGITGLSLADGATDSDLMVVLTVAPGLPAGAPGKLVVAFAENLAARLGGRLRRGISVAVDIEAADLEAQRPRGQD